MAFRTVVIDTHSKLEYSLGYLVFRTAEATKRIFLEEVRTVIINSPMVSMTTSLLIELTNRKIKVIFCDEKHNPCGEILPCYGNNVTTKRIKTQIRWDQETADFVWKALIEAKIQNQASLLLLAGRPTEAQMLTDYATCVEPGDPTNREGHAAKVYFNSVFFPGFTREQDCLINAALNYGYSIILSEINRAVVAAGYLTQLGIHHKSEFNEFCLSCDLIEPLRFLVDKKAKTLKEDADFKKEMISLLAKDVFIREQKQSLGNAIGLYVNSFFDAMEKGDPNRIAFISDGE